MRSAAQLFGTLALVGLVCKFWWLIALELAAVVLWTHIPGWWAGHQATVAAEQRRLAAIAARADRQHALDVGRATRGTYGEKVSH